MRTTLTAGLAIILFLVVSTVIQAGVERAFSEPVQVEGLEYVGQFRGAEVWQGPLGHRLSGCTILTYPLPMGSTGYAIGCR